MGQRDYKNHHLAELLMDFQKSNNFDQRIKEITRHRMVNRNGQNVLQTSLLDHVYTNGFHVDDVRVFPTIASDHNLIGIIIKNKNIARKFTNKIYIRDWRKYSKDAALTEINKHDWEVINQTTDLTTLNDRIEQAIRSTLDKTAPWTCMRHRGDYSEI